MSSLSPMARVRLTFLRRHVEAELRPRGKDGPREEVLALANLRHRLRKGFPDVPADAVAREIDAAVTVPGFFYDSPLYLKIPVTCVRGTSTGKEWGELTDLLLDEATPRGVLVRARSGAGKTTAMLKAFYDCLYATSHGPRLPRYLPCFLRNLTLPQWEEGQIDKPLVEALLLRAAGLGDAALGQLRRWLFWSPPLLILLDLNTAAEKVAKSLSKALPAFLEAYEKQAHRIIVAYRNFGDEEVTRNLTNFGFVEYDLRPLDHAAALGYLGNLRRYEQQLRKQVAARLGLPLDAPDGNDQQAELAHFGRLIRQHAHNYDSVLSTPLLMHLFSLLPVGRQEDVRCLADLYREVIEEQLDREYGAEPGRPRLIEHPPAAPAAPEAVVGSPFQTTEGRTLLKKALVRVALAILAQSGDRQETTRLKASKDTNSERLLSSLLTRPAFAGRLCPTPPDWPRGDYFTRAFSASDKDAVVRSSLLLFDGAEYGFLHASFLHYFAALSVRCPEEPYVGLSPLGGENDPWYGQAVRRLHEAPRAWRMAAEFLGGMLEADELKALTTEALLMKPKEGWPEILEALVRGRRDPDDPVLEGIDAALHHKEGRLAAEPRALRSEVFHHLRDATPSPPCREWAARLEQRAGAVPWFVSRRPTRWPLPSLQAHSGPVLSVASLPDGRVVAGGKDGKILLWDPVRRQSSVLAQHPCALSCMAVSADGCSVLSGDEDGQVWLTAVHQHKTRPVLQHAGPVLAVAVSDDGQTVVSGGEEGDVWRARVDAEPHKVERLVTHRYPVRYVAVSANGRTVFTGGSCILWRRAADDGQSTTEPSTTEFKSDVNGVVTSANGEVVVVTESSRLWRLVGSTKPGSRWELQRRAVLALAATRSLSGVVSGDREGNVLIVWSGKNPPDKINKSHHGAVRSVAIAADGQAAVSGGEDGKIRLYRHLMRPVTLISHDGAVCSMAISADGTSVFSGGEDGIVRRTLLEPSPGDERPAHDGPVCAVCVTPDGRTVVSGGADGKVLCWRDGKADEAPLLDAECRVNALAVGSAGRIAAGTEDGWVWYKAGEASIAPLLRHDRAVSSVAIPPDRHVVVSGGWDGQVRWAELREGEPPRLRATSHGDVVFAVAVNATGDPTISGGVDGVVWRHVACRRTERTMSHHSRSVLAVAVSPDGGKVISAGEDGMVVRSPGSVLHTGFSRSAVALRFDDSGTVVVCAGDSTVVELWRDGVRYPVGWLANAAVRCLAWSDAGKGLLVVGLADGEVLELELR